MVSNARTILEAPGELKRVEVEILVLNEYTVFSETACAYFKMDKNESVILFYVLLHCKYREGKDTEFMQAKPGLLYVVIQGLFQERVKNTTYSPIVNF